MRKIRVCFDYPTASDGCFFLAAFHFEINRVTLSEFIKPAGNCFIVFYGGKQSLFQFFRIFNR